MDLQEILKKEEERVKKLGEELAGAIQAEDANAKSPEKSIQDEKQPEQLTTRPSEEIRADLEDAEKTVAALKHVSEMPLAEKLGEFVKDKAGDALNFATDLVDHLHERTLVELASAAKTAAIEFVIPAIAQTATGSPEAGEIARQAGQTIDKSVEAAGGLDNILTVAQHPATKMLQDAKALPGISDEKPVTDLIQKQEKEWVALEKQIDKLEKKFEEHQASNPNKAELHEKFDKQVELLRESLEKKHEKEAQTLLGQTLLQEPIRQQIF
ncbi:MAG TPA: hypothetical protein VNZ53_46540 [Steroidobacteraceae bacterium]|nr:hypothetical protein [Steroidobacteraceae bacterium]